MSSRSPKRSAGGSSTAVAEISTPTITNIYAGHSETGVKVQEAVDSFTALYDEKSGTAAERKKQYTSLVNKYYDLVTDFYDYGWGLGFHFGLRYDGEAFLQSLARHEHYLALKLNLRPGMKVLDVGCGVGGPMMEIARFSGASVVGINNNAYQIIRGTKHVHTHHLQDICSFVKGDFMQMPFADNSFDSVYAIEATVHSPRKVGVYGEILRVLKPGAWFAGYEWCLSNKYDPNNPEHVEAKKKIEIGDGIPELEPVADIRKALIEAGFELVEFKDMSDTDKGVNPVPWWQPLIPSYTVDGFRSTPLGRGITAVFVKFFETLRIIPSGSKKAHDVLQTAVDGLVKGGDTGIFTPMQFILARKPETTQAGGRRKN